MIRALFVSSLARDRAPTAAQTFADLPGLRTDFAGLDPQADAPLSPEQLDWADRIYVFEKRHRAALAAGHARALRGRAVADLDIPGLYTFMQPELVELLRDRLGPELGAPPRARAGR